MTNVVRTFNGVLPELRKLYLKNREGIVVDSIKTKDLDEYVNSLEICLINSGISDIDTLNKAICIRKDIDEYIVIFIVKSHKEEYVNTVRAKTLGKNIYTFNEWFEIISR